MCPVGHTLRVLADEQGRFVQQLHVHVNVVDAVVGQVGELDVSVNAVKTLHDAVHAFLGVVARAPLVERPVFIED